MKTTFFVLMIPVCFLAAVNLFWLGFSTTRVSIAGRGLVGVTVHFSDKTMDLGDMRRGESRFMFLPRVANASYWITFSNRNQAHTVCKLEVNETGEHVEARLYDNRESVCTVTDPMLSDLMVLKFF